MHVFASLTLFGYLSYLIWRVGSSLLQRAGLLQPTRAASPKGALEVVTSVTRSGADCARSLEQNGHFSGNMYDIGDALHCAALLGLRAAEFTFNQALLKMQLYAD
mmetsp:Transcript_33504/g.78805  ORF Transcript_33504/g.78805 Transcript_33504/m.78805 type:complete len:105 (+) Transcript_33504:1548-1862(+)